MAHTVATSRFKRFALLTLLTLATAFLAPVSAFAEQPTYYRPEPIRIDNAYTLTAPKWLHARPVYLSIVNSSDKDDMLIGASSPFAKEVILQYTHDYGFDVKTMRPMENQELLIPARSIVHLRPGGIHLMLNGLTQPLDLGLEVPVKLKFKNSPDLFVKAIIHEQPDTPATNKYELE